MRNSGEETQAIGIRGVADGKDWLESTLRVRIPWVAGTGVDHQLQFQKADGGSFAFDLGGTLIGGGLDGKVLFCEVKTYAEGGDLLDMYRTFVAQAYRAEWLGEKYGRGGDRYLFLSWARFGTTKSDKKLLSVDFVKESISKNKDISLEEGIDIDQELAEQTSRKLLVAVISARQTEILSLERFERRRAMSALDEYREEGR